MAVINIATTLRNAQVNAARDAIDGGSGPGTIQIRTGAMPATPQDAATGTLLGTLTFSDPSFPAASGGTASANAITQDSAADATGTATWARLLDSAGTAVMDVDVTATGGGGAIQLNNTSIVAGGPIILTSMSITAPAS